jgi:hypothetical protein
MSHPSKIDFLEEARLNGYFVELFFICTENSQINQSRVQSRVQLGGHDVPIEKIHQRYYRSLNNLFKATFNSHRVVLFDNSAVGGLDRIDYLRDKSLDGTSIRVEDGLRPFVEILTQEVGIQVTQSGKIPDWAERFWLQRLREWDERFKEKYGVSSVQWNATINDRL